MFIDKKKLNIISKNYNSELFSEFSSNFWYKSKDFDPEPSP
jgi:hypothetical protein